jgi:hypothetical protein
MCKRSLPSWRRSIVLVSQEALYALICAEEERSTWRRTDKRRTYTTINTVETAGGKETGRGLKTGLECVEREEREIDGCTSEGTCEEGGLEGWRVCGHVFEGG